MDESDDDMPNLLYSSSSSDSSSDEDVAVATYDDHLPELVSDSSDEFVGPTNASNEGDSSDVSLPPLV